jgi:asparagine synthase (glutamine-hydrolysing)
MCGIFGLLSKGARSPAQDAVLAAMAGALHHRGPDGAKLLTSRRFALGATRLRIVDPTEGADQPFVAPGAAAWMACNGEIYNADALRLRFPSYPYRTRTDIEPLLPAHRELGTELFTALDGMFAIALWEPATGTLTLARDRAGEKPLFYAWVDGDFWFASEIQALLANPALSRDVDPVAVSQYLTLGYPLEPRTLFASIRRVEAGTAMRVSERGVEVQRYWQPVDFLRSRETRARRPARDEVRELGSLLDNAVRRQVVADAPVGVFLSGGLDSSLIATLASRALAPEQLTSFTARFDAESYDEGDWALRCANAAGTRHVNVPCGTGQLLHALSNVAGRLAEPVSDPAVLPTFLLAEAAARHVRVVLSGEGADELFGGYPTYLGHRAADGYAHLPAPLRSAIARAVRALPVSHRKVSLEFLLKRFVTGTERPWPERHVSWFGSGGSPWLATESQADWLGPWLDPYREFQSVPGAMLLDYQSYLRDNLLVKMDRATMLNSIEGRAPFLDATLSRFAFGLPPELKLRRATSKWILKEAAAQWLPRDQRRRVKRGLSVPIGDWLNGDLGATADRLLAPARLDRHGLVNAGEVARILAEHRRGTANNARPLWTVIMLQLWLERWQPALADDDPVALGELPSTPPPAPLRQIGVPESVRWGGDDRNAVA